MTATTSRRCPSCKMTLLSRYNTEPLCAVCMRATREPSAVRALVPAWLWDSEPMRQALARTDLGAMLAIFRATAGLTQTDLGNLIPGWSQSMVSMIENGQRGTLYDIRELFRFVDLIGMPREALLPLFLGNPDVTLEADGNVKLQGDAMDLDRRSFNGIAVGLAASALLPEVGAPDHVDMAHVRYLQSCLEQIRNGYRSLGGGMVLSEALRHFATAKAMLDDADYTERVGKRLLVVTAELGESAGWAAYDQNNQQLARQLYTEAAHLAASTEDVSVKVHLYTNLAQQSSYLARTTGQQGLAREALRFTDRAAEASRYEPSPKLHGLIALRKAYASAVLGDEPAFRSAISTVRHELDRGQHPTDPAWAGFITHSEVIGFEAIGYEALGRIRGEDTDQAIRLYQAVLDDPDRSARDQVYYRARLANALLNDGDVTQAISEGSAVLPSTSGVASTRSIAELHPVRAAAEQAGAEEFCARFDQAVQELAT